MYATTRQPIRKLEIMEREMDRLQEENNMLRETLSSCNPAHVRKQLAQAEESYQEYTALIEELLELRQEYQNLNQEVLNLRKEYQLLLREAAGSLETGRNLKQRGWPKAAASQTQHHLRR